MFRFSVQCLARSLPFSCVPNRTIFLWKVYLSVLIIFLLLLAPNACLRIPRFEYGHLLDLNRIYFYSDKISYRWNSVKTRRNNGANFHYTGTQTKYRGIRFLPRNQLASHRSNSGNILETARQPARNLRIFITCSATRNEKNAGEFLATPTSGLGSSRLLEPPKTFIVQFTLGVSCLQSGYIKFKSAGRKLYKVPVTPPHLHAIEPPPPI